MNLVKIAWRNIWRNKVRSGTVIASVVVGLMAGVFAAALVEGMMHGRFENFIEKEISHLQVHHPEFIEQPEVPLFIQTPLSVLEQVDGISGVKSVTARSRAQAMIASATYTAGVTLNGIIPDREEQTTGFSANVIEGEFLAAGDKNSMLIGKALASKLNVGIGSRVVLTFQDAENEMVAAAFTVKGIFETYYARYDESTAFVPLDYLSEQLQLGDYFHEIAVLASSMDEVQDVKKEVALLFPNDKVRTWNEISPELEYWVELGGVFSYIFVIVLMLGLAFGLLNTMLMSVFERTREIGMLMAIGMSKRTVFFMIVFETFILSIIGTVISIAGSVALIRWLSERGIDLSAFSDVMQEIGFETLIYPYLAGSFYVFLPIIVLLISLLAAIYPALKALRLNPSEAVRK